MSSWHNYPKIYNLGHSAIKELLLDEVRVDEKIDGSQLSAIVDDFNNGEGLCLRVRSKGAELNLAAPEKMFIKAIDTLQGLDLHQGWTYRCEYLAKPKHNTLVYDRIPNKHLIIFDININQEEYLDYDAMKAEAERIGLECVPLLKKGKIESPEEFRALLNTISILGGQKIEGVVIKNYKRFGIDGKALMGKFVSEAFKEVHQRDWKESNPKQGDILLKIIEQYKTPARWNNAIQHLQELGLITDSPNDIGLIIKEVGMDIEQECKTEIKDLLWLWAWDKIRRGCINGIPEWYKNELMKRQFENDIKDKC